MLINLQLASVVRYVFLAYYVVLLIRVAFTWMGPLAYRPGWRSLYGFTYSVTEPLLGPIHRLLSRYSRGMPVDFSPLILWLILMAAEHVVLRLLLPK